VTHALDSLIAGNQTRFENVVKEEKKEVEKPSRPNKQCQNDKFQKKKKVGGFDDGSILSLRETNRKKRPQWRGFNHWGKWSGGCEVVNRNVKP